VLKLNKYDEILEEIKLVKEELTASKLLRDNGHYRVAMIRVYYVMFHCVRALLMIKNIKTKTHTGLIFKFKENFILTNELNDKFGKYLFDSFRYRQEYDYGSYNEIDFQLCLEFVNIAEEFLNETIRYLIEKGVNIC